MANKRSRRRPNRARRATTSRRLISLVNRTTIGAPMRAPSDPPRFSSAPWATVTLPINKSVSFPFTAKDIYTEFLAFMQWNEYLKPDPDKTKPGTTLPLEFRLESVRVWGGKDSAISLVIFDSVAGQHKLAELVDNGSPLNYCKLGWHFGSITRSNALKFDDDDSLFTVDSKKPYLVYLQLLFRTYDAKPKTTVTNQVAYFRDSLNRVSNLNFENMDLRQMQF